MHGCCLCGSRIRNHLFLGTLSTGTNNWRIEAVRKTGKGRAFPWICEKVWVLPCSSSAAHRAFLLDIQSRCRKGQSTNSGRSSWRDKLSLSSHRRPACNTLPECSPRCSPASNHCILMQRQRWIEVQRIHIFGKSQWKKIGERESGIHFITARFQSV